MYCADIQIETICPSGLHHNDDGGCTYDPAMWSTITQVVSVPCDNDGAGGGNNSGPNGGGGGIGTTPITTTPVPCTICPSQGEIEEIDPCASLNNFLDPSKGNAKDMLEQVESDGTGYAGEQGAIFTNNNGLYNSIQLPASQANNAYANGIRIPKTNPNIYAAVHTHPDNESQTPMFSLSDLMELYSLYNVANQNNKSDVAFMLLLPNKSIYAIKVENLNNLKAFLDSFIYDAEIENITDMKKKYEMMNKKFDKMCCSSCNGQNTVNSGYENKFLVGFLNALRNNGVGLYRGTGDFDGWEKMIAPTNPINTNYTTSPCN